MRLFRYYGKCWFYALTRVDKVCRANMARNKGGAGRTERAAEINAMSKQTQWTWAVMAGVCLLIGAAKAGAQSPGMAPGYGGPMPVAAAPGYGGQPGYMAAPGYGVPGGYGAPMSYSMPGPAPGMAPGMAPGGVVPAYAAMQGEGPVAEPMPMEGDGYYEDGEYYDEGLGLGFRGIGREILSIVLPYSEGGLAAPRWFDIRAEAVNFRREHISRRVDYSSNGLNGDIVLSTENLTFDPQWGYRLVAALQVGAGSNLEFNYLGGANWSSRATYQSDTNGLFSSLSNFGLDPFLGFGETDNAHWHSIAYSSNFNSYELNLRRRWQGRSDRLQGSWLGGLRYFQLTEDFDYKTRSAVPTPGAYMDYSVGTNNSLTGFQIGGDAWLALLPGMHIGSELKAGVFGNHANQITRIYASSIANGLMERTKSDDVALIAEWSFAMTYRINYHWTVRAGYDLLYLDGVALATENFNSGPPQLTTQSPVVRDRVPFFNDNGSAFYHGWTFGAEWLW